MRARSYETFSHLLNLRRSTSPADRGLSSACDRKSGALGVTVRQQPVTFGGIVLSSIHVRQCRRASQLLKEKHHEASHVSNHRSGRYSSSSTTPVSVPSNRERRTKADWRYHSAHSSAGRTVYV